jgi:predicted AAA+ superfamily ATPase
MILDEVQNAPELLSYIQEIVDNNSNIRFILSGSSNFTMIQSVSQSLAGRSAIFELLPLSINELPNEAIGTTSLSELLYKGLYPSIWSNGTPPTIMYRNYVKTYLERDVRNISAIKDLSLFQKFLRLCANRIGSIFVASQLANELGVSVNTILSWLSILEASYVVIMLSPFHENTRKRLTKSPKLYFTDTGLAAYLLDIETITQLNNDKMRGHLIENLIVTEALKYRFNKGKDSNLYFYRDSHMNEVDLILKNADKLKLIEIKSSETYHQEFEKGIKAFCKEFGDKVEDNTIIYAGVLENTTREIKLLNYSRLYEIL